MVALNEKPKSRIHALEASVDTVHWGYFDAALKPVLTVEMGDTVTISTVSGRPIDLPKPGSGFVVPPVLTEIHGRLKQGPVGHILTGPVAVRGARAGQVLEVRIKSVDLNCDWGYNVIFPLAGGLPDDFEQLRVIHFPLERERSAIEVGLTGTFELHVRDDMQLEWPLAETPTHVITMAFHPDLDDCVVVALRDMVKLICVCAGLSREDAYSLCSIAADIRVTQVVNGNKGIHMMLDKRYLIAGRP